jgi:uncharacterized membrane protein YkgB
VQIGTLFDSVCRLVHTFHVKYFTRKGCITMFIAQLDRFDALVTRWMAQYSIALLRIGLGLVFFWFGVLKFVPNLSPAQALATSTISLLTFGLVGPTASLPLLALWECIIGVGLMTGRWTRTTLLLLWVQMAGTLTPLVLFPDAVFTQVPIAPTLEGQYIIKNIVLIGAGLVIGATARGGRLIAEGQGKNVIR